MKGRWTKYVLIILLGYMLGILQSQSKLEAQTPAPFLSSPYYGEGNFVRGFTADGHEGQDYGLHYEPVLAVADGTVHLARWYTDHATNYPTECYRYTDAYPSSREEINKAYECSYGLYVYINHDNGYQTRYAHLSAIAVEKYDQVKRGQVIGTSGTTGWSTGPHLHFEVVNIDSGDRIDPDSLWIDGERANPSRPIPAPPQGQVITVDDGDTAFDNGQNVFNPCSPNPDSCDAWWYVSGGQNNDSLYTYANGDSQDYWAEWYPNALSERPGWYDIQVYVPNTNKASSWFVPYRIDGVADNIKIARLDQYGSRGRWISLGTHRFLFPG